MNDSFTLLAEKDLAAELAIELALQPGLDVQLAVADAEDQSPADSTREKSEPLYFMEFSNIETIVVTFASTATAMLTFAQAVLGFLRDRSRKNSGEPTTDQPRIVVNNQLVVTANQEDGESVLSSYLQGREIRQIVILTGGSTPSSSSTCAGS